MFDRTRDARIRAAAFDWLSGQVATHGDVVLPRAVLAQGFRFEGRRVPLVGPQGIFKPAIMDLPLSITTAPSGPYDDAFGPDELLSYRYRGTDPHHRDNQGLRFAMSERLPLVYFHGLVPGRYLAAWPVYVVGDQPALLTFTVAVDEADYISAPLEAGHAIAEDTTIRRRYATRLVQQRLHQRAFRERVLEAYRHQCALCRLRHDELLDAAHIAPDAEPDGEPVVSNGLALCKLHHAAFDRFFVGIRPDYIVEVRTDVLAEEDGPTLRHAIQALHGQRITVPRRLEQRPSTSLLEIRFERFLARSVRD